MEAVVLHRVGFLAYFCSKQGQDFKTSAAPLYPNTGQVPPPTGIQYVIVQVRCMETTACNVHLVHACNTAIPLTSTAHVPSTNVAQFQIPNLHVNYMYFCDLCFLRLQKNTP